MLDPPEPAHDRDSSFERLLEGRLHDPFGWLGLHPDGTGWVVRVYEPRALEVSLLRVDTDAAAPLVRVDARGLFEWRGPVAPAWPCRLRATFDNGSSREWHDPYSFAAQITDDEIYLFNEGRLTQAGRTVQAHGVTLVGETNLPALVAADASALYARNVLDFLKLVTTKEAAFHLNLEDDIVAACLVAHGGAVTRP